MMHRTPNTNQGLRSRTSNAIINTSFYLLTEIFRQPTKMKKFNRLPTEIETFNRLPTMTEF